jgi:CheY-like chemotaxis protein
VTVEPEKNKLYAMVDLMKTVIVADSDAFQRQLVDMLLAVDNYQVKGFETGRQVLEYLQSNVPDLAILDYSLPDINGADLCAKLRSVKRLSKVPVILVTSTHKFPLVKGIAAAVKADVVLSKPLGDKKLREQVRSLIKRDIPLTLPDATALVMDPILEQALNHLPYLTHTQEAVLPSLKETETFNHDSLMLADPLASLEVADFIDTKGLYETPVPQLFQNDVPSLESLPSATYTNANDLHLPALDFYSDYSTTGSISEQELLESLSVQLDHPSSPPPMFDPAPQAYRLSSKETPVDSIPAQLAPLQQIPQYTNLDLLKEQVEQLGSENEHLKTTLREVDSGHPLHTSRSYLDALEELEMLRRLTDIQAKQLNELQKHNQSLIEDLQMLKTQRRPGFLGFWSAKKPDRDSV